VGGVDVLGQGPPGRLRHAGRLRPGGADVGRLYYSTHRGSTRVTTEQYHYKGDWVLAHDLKTGKTEIVAHAPVAKHCIPTGVLDPERLIFYGGTAPGVGGDGEGVKFFAWDVKAGKILFECAGGPARAHILSRSTGRVYWNPGEDDAGGLVRFDPAAPGPPQKIDAVIGLRAATAETPDGVVYTVSQGGKGGEPKLYAFDVKTEKVRELGPAAVGTQGDITTLDADPTGRFLYYIPGAHGGSDADGAAVVQFDVKTGRRKVIAFLHPAFRDRIGATLRGTYGAALDPAGDKLYVTWNVSRGTKAWDCCALTVLHIPQSERQP
jgi:hypothetical protein